MFMRLGTPSGLRITSTGVPSSRNGMSASGTILEMTPLLPWRPASLSPSAILRFLATNTRTRSLTPGDRSSPAARLNVLTSMTTPPSPCGTFSEVSRTSRAFSLKIARISFSSAVSSVSPFGVTLPTSRSPDCDLGADADDAAVVEVAQRLLGAVRDVARDLLVAELGRAGVDLVLLDVDRGELVVLDQALGEDDRVLEVVALPGHEGDHQVLAQRHLAEVGGRAVGEHVARLDRLPRLDQRLLVDQRALVGAHELLEVVLLALAVVAGDHEALRVDVVDRALDAGQHHVAGVDGGAALHARADQRRVGLEQRHRLALHVRAHQRAVGVVVLEERDHRRGDGPDLLGRDVHEVDVRGLHVHVRAREGAAQDRVAGQLAVLVERRRWPGRSGAPARPSRRGGRSRP